MNLIGVIEKHIGDFFCRLFNTTFKTTYIVSKLQKKNKSQLSIRKVQSEIISNFSQFLKMFNGMNKTLPKLFSSMLRS